VRKLLLSYGFRPQKSASHRHMIRGGITPSQRYNIYGLAHFSVGRKERPDANYPNLSLFILVGVNSKTRSGFSSLLNAYR